jgi:hypothetical protein
MPDLWIWCLVDFRIVAEWTALEREMTLYKHIGSKAVLEHMPKLVWLVISAPFVVECSANDTWLQASGTIL